jgi:YD repeat-containing protein
VICRRCHRPHYDLRGLTTSESTALGSVSYGYDALSRMTSMAQGTSSVGYFYDAYSRLISMSLPLGMSVEYGYDAYSKRTSLTYKRNGAFFADLKYEYDVLCRRTRMTGSVVDPENPTGKAGE